jgi:STE24 endopeptidase
MNVYGVICLAALLLEFLVQLVADVLTVRSLDPEVPPEFRDVYDAERYARSQQYARARKRFGLVPATVHLVALLGFWFAGGFPWLDGLVAGAGWGPVGTGLLFLGALGFANALLGLPFSWWSTFVIEERFGFNRTTPRTFWMDRVKGLLLAIVLGGPLLAAVLWFFEAAGEHAWLACWGLVALFSVLLQLVAPAWIMPLFNRFEPLPDGDLRTAVLAYAEKVSFSLEGLFVIDGSKRSTKANAFFTGFGKKRRVALYDTLIERHATDELVAVVAHEIGHYKRGHIVKGTVLGILQAGVVFFLLSIFLEHRGLFAAFGLGEPTVHAGLVLFALLYAPIDMLLSVGMQAVSRKHEYEADAFARETTGDGEPLIAGLKRMSVESLSNLTPHRLDVVLNHSHPPLTERIRALRA